MFKTLSSSSCTSFNSLTSYAENDIRILQMFDLTTEALVFTSKVSVKVHNVRFKTYQYVIESKNINGIQTFNSYSYTSRCVCQGVLIDKKYNFLMTNNTIDSLEIDYYVEDIEGECGEQKVIPITYQSVFKYSNTVSYIIKYAYNIC